MNISILMAYRDRKESLLSVITQLKRNLFFFKDQLEVIIIDLGSKENLKTELEKFPFVSYHYIDYKGTFCKSWALNMAFKKSSHDWIFTLDTDCIVFEKFLAKIKENIDSQEKGYYYLLGGIRDLPEGITQFIQQKSIVTRQLKTMIDENFDKMVNLGGVGIMLLHRDNYNEVKGYDEKMIGWGREDSDFVNRLRLVGLKEKTIPPLPDQSLYHLHHPRNEISYNNLMAFLQNDMVEIYNKENKIIQCTPNEDWGTIDHPPDQFRYESLLDFKIEENAPHPPILKLNNISINQLQEPTDYANGFQEFDPDFDPTIPTIIMGGGLNYAAKHLSQKVEKLYIIEKYNTTKQLAIKTNNLDPSLFIPGEFSAFFEHITAFETLKLKRILVHQPSFDFDPQWYEGILKVINAT